MPRKPVTSCCLIATYFIAYDNKLDRHMILCISQLHPSLQSLLLYQHFTLTRHIVHVGPTSFNQVYIQHHFSKITSVWINVGCGGWIPTQILFFSMQLAEPHSKFCLLVQILDNMEYTITKVHTMGKFVFNLVNLVHNGNGNNFGSLTRYESVLWVSGSQNGLRGNC